MPTNYHVRVYCEAEQNYKRTIQVDVLDPDWIPVGCETHITRDFVVEEEEPG